MSRPRRGLVLGGGGVLGAAWQVGAMRALEEELGLALVDVDMIVGTSAGSVVACFLAAGISPAEQYDFQRGSPSGRLTGLEVDYSFGGVRPRPPSPLLGSPRLVASWLRKRGRPGTAALLAGLLPKGRGSMGGLVSAVETILPDWPQEPELRIVVTDFSTGARHWFGGVGAGGDDPPGAELDVLDVDAVGAVDAAEAEAGAAAADAAADAARLADAVEGAADLDAAMDAAMEAVDAAEVADAADLAEAVGDPEAVGDAAAVGEAAATEVAREAQDFGSGIPDGEKATRIGTGRFVTPPPAVAMAASCAMPSVFAPVAVNGRMFVDGGASSMASVDLLAGHELDEVYVLAPLAQLVQASGPWSVGRFLLRQWRQPQTAGLLREIDLLKDEGAEVLLLAPTAEDQVVLGLNPMAPDRRLDVLETALRNARTVLRSRGVGAT